jgi:hypothetical protein
VHGVGTVVFTVSAQFGVPVPYIWALTRGITSYAREIVASLAEVERRPAAFLAQLAPVAQSQRSSATDGHRWMAPCDAAPKGLKRPASDRSLHFEGKGAVDILRQEAGLRTPRAYLWRPNSGTFDARAGRTASASALPNFTLPLPCRRCTP